VTTGPLRLALSGSLRLPDSPLKRAGTIGGDFKLGVAITRPAALAAAPPESVRSRFQLRTSSFFLRLPRAFTFRALKRLVTSEAGRCCPTGNVESASESVGSARAWPVPHTT
jgi:hypothetical protein